MVAPSPGKKSWDRSESAKRTRRYAQALRYCELLSERIMSCLKEASYSSARMIAFWLSNYDLPFPRVDSGSPTLFEQRDFFRSAPNLAPLLDEEVAELLSSARLKAQNDRTTISWRMIATDDILEDKHLERIPRRITIPDSKWCRTFKLSLIRGESRSNNIGLELIEVIND